VSTQVKPEFGPTLPEILGPRLRALSRGGRIAVGVAAGVMALGLVWLLFLRDDGRTPLVVRGEVPFNLLYDEDKLVRAEPQAGEDLRLETLASDPDPESFTVRAVRLPAYQGDASGILPAYATALIEQMRAADPNFILRSEGRARVNSQPGYQIQFQTKQGGRTAYGRRALLFPDEPGAREGGDITMVAVRSPSMPNVDEVGSNGPTKLPYRSFRLGTERP
jgi:hypothetical protein